MAVYPACRQTLKMNIPQIMPRGQKFNWCGRRWKLLDILKDAQSGDLCFLAIMTEPVWDDCVAFGDDNNWENSKIRRDLVEQVLPTLNADVMRPIVTDMADESGNENYGKTIDMISLLTADAYRVYRPWMPRYRDWIWLSTPLYSIPGSACYVRLVNPSGALGYYHVYYAIGLVPGLCAISQFALANGEIEVIND